MSSTDLPPRLRCAVPGQHLNPCRTAVGACSCVCHTNGAYQPPCDVDPAVGCHAHHDQAAAAATCSGCLPRQAADGSLACAVCERRARAALTGDPGDGDHRPPTPSLPALWADLAERPRLGGAPLGEDAGVPLGERAVTARQHIRSILVSWASILRVRHGISAPDEHAVARRTRDTAHTASEAAQGAREESQRLDALARSTDTATVLVGGPAVDLPAGRVDPDPGAVAELAAQARQQRYDAEAARAEAARQHGIAAAARDARLTGLDVVEALAEHLDTHLATLLADEETAARVLAQLVSVHRAARAVANPSRDTRQRIVCACGEWVALDPDDEMVCPGCGEHGVLAWWVTHHAATPAAEFMTTTELVGWLLVQGIDLGAPERAEAKIRKWHERYPAELPKAPPPDPDDPAAPKDRRARYSSAGALALARRLTGQVPVPAQRLTLPAAAQADPPDPSGRQESA